MEKELKAFTMSAKKEVGIDKSANINYKKLIRILWKQLFKNVRLGRISNYEVHYYESQNAAKFNFTRKGIKFEIVYNFKSDSAVMIIESEGEFK